MSGQKSWSSGQKSWSTEASVLKRNFQLDNAVLQRNQVWWKLRLGRRAPQWIC